MVHSIPPQKHGPLTGAMTHAIEACVHCGFCLAACPTYREFGQEMDTPRGRIVLMRRVLEGELPWEAAQTHVDRCLGCLACEPACPSGVSYRELISPFRAAARSHVKRPFVEQLRNFLLLRTVSYPSRFRWALQAGRLGKSLRSMIPAMLRPMVDLVPDSLPSRGRWPTLVAAQGTRRARVALLSGCAQQVLSPDINSATIEVLSRQGVEVVLPPKQGCCAGLAWHTGDLALAQAMARKNLASFPSDVDAILSNAAGCGSTLHEYPLILRGTPHEADAHVFQRRVMDVSVFLARLGLNAPPPHSGATVRIVYHDACHLSNGQGVRREPRELLRSLPGVDLCELADGESCCGSAGTYNLDQPATAAALGERKAKGVIATGAELVATGNIGCLVQLQSHLTRLGSPIRVRHTLQVLRDAYSDRGLAGMK